MKKENIKEDGAAMAAASPVPANAMGNSSSKAGTGGIDTYDPLLRSKKKLRDIVKRKPV
jgi:hypothetical protein